MQSLLTGHIVPRLRNHAVARTLKGDPDEAEVLELLGLDSQRNKRLTDIAHSDGSTMYNSRTYQMIVFTRETWPTLRCKEMC